MAGARWDYKPWFFGIALAIVVFASNYATTKNTIEDLDDFARSLCQETNYARRLTNDRIEKYGEVFAELVSFIEDASETRRNQAEQFVSEGRMEEAKLSLAASRRYARSAHRAEYLVSKVHSLPLLDCDAAQVRDSVGSA